MLRRILLCLMMGGFVLPQVAMSAPISPKSKDYKEYIKYFEQVYKVFEDNYYLKPDREVYNFFIKNFNEKIYAQLKGEGKSDDYVKWRSAWYLVDALKSKEERFSQFYPPKPAETFKKEALGQQVDLGVEGEKVELGFLITRMEPHADAYAKGLREGDIIVALDGQSILALSQAEIERKLTPLVDTKVGLSYIAHEDKAIKVVEVVSKEYFKQTVFLYPVAVPGVFCLDIPKFDRMSGEDLFRFLQLIQKQNPKGLILDLRGNPGGPPLAAREMAAFFLKGGEDFAYFQKRGSEKAVLDVPIIADELKFQGPIVILVDENSGSASELFAGIMQFRRRAAVIGTNTAGQVLLKSMFSLDDGSMVALVTAPGYYPDGTRFSFDGVTPDKIINGAPKDGLINLAAAYIAQSTGQ